MPIDPRNDPKRRLTGAPLVALIAVAVSSVGPMVQHFEGYRGKAYRDPVGILTQCYGETANIRPDLIYSKDECAEKMRARMRRDYAPKIVACAPDFANPMNRWPFEAAIDASYNAGPAAVCRSPMVKAFNAGRWDAGCAAFVGWYTTARGVPLAGLVRRRIAERDHCLTGKMPA